jgi:hypothetical protein
MKSLTIDGITITKNERGFQLRVPSSVDQNSLLEWKEKNARKIKQFKKANK